ncbi:MAG: flippase [Candidatus Krumholzibacteriota bacterium]|nr:flippase [Candidatus Krumholzibacteriota bacterium]
MKSKVELNGSLAAGYLWTFGSTALPLISAFTVSLIVARCLGPRVVGLINWTMALATIFLIPAKFGVEGAASRLITEYQVSSPRRIRELIVSSVVMRTVFTVPTAALAVFFAAPLASFFREEALVPLFRIGGLLIFAVSFNELSSFLILGLNRFRLLFLVRSSMLVIRVGLVLWAVYYSLGASGVIGAYIIALLIPALVIFLILLRIKPEGEGPPPGTAGFSPPVWKRLLGLSAPLAVSGASVTVYSLLDKLMLGYFGGAAEVGIYSMARNLLETSLFPTFALVMTLRPALAGAWTAGKRQRCSDLINRSLINSLIYSACVVVVFICLAQPLVRGLFTEKFLASADLLILFSPLILMRCLGSVILPSLIAGEKAGTYAKLTLVGAILNFVLNLLFIPRWKAVGAVVATLLAYLPIEILGLRSVALLFPGWWRKGDFTRAIKTFALGVLTVFFYLRFAPEPRNLPFTFLHAFLLTGFFLAGSILTRTLSRAQMRELARPFRRARKTR